MYRYSRSNDFIEMLPIFFGVLIGIFVAMLIVYILIKKQDDKKELIKCKVKVLEKPVQQGHIEWYIVERENGERLKLRSFKANSILISVGDAGIIEYKGSTIQSFHRQ